MYLMNFKNEVLVAGDTVGSLEYLKHGEALAVAKVADKAVVACTQIVDGLHVGTRNRRKRLPFLKPRKSPMVQD